jgi:predicted Zn-dependent protease
LRRRWPIFALVLLAAISSAARVGAESLAPPSAHISDGQTRRQLARIYAWSGKYTEAELTFKRLMKEHPNDAELLLDWASMEAARGHAQDSRRLLASAIPLAKDKETALLTQARAMNLVGRFLSSRKNLPRPFGQAPQGSRLSLGFGQALDEQSAV